MSDPRDDDAIDALLRRQFDGPLPDDGFSDRVMRHLPQRRPRLVTWPLWLGLLLGAAACWASLSSSPLLQAGWHGWIGGQRSAATITLMLAITGMSLLASWWSMAEADDR